MERLLSLLFVCLATLAVAQERMPDRSKLPQGSRAVRARVLKERMPFSPSCMDTLQMKAEGSKPLNALRHLESALVIADSLKDRGRERDLLFKLALAQERAGKAKDALASLRAALFLKDSLALVEVERSASVASQQTSKAHDELQRMQTAHGDAIRTMQEQHDRARDQWRTLLIAAVGVVVLFLGMLLWALMRVARYTRVPYRPKSADGAPPPVVDALEQNAVQRLVPVTEPSIELPVAPTDPEAEMLLALFHKRMPERLQALIDARDRSDYEKVGRVLATMRPQLAHHDGGKFNERCARLIAAHEQVLSPDHASDLDQLIEDVSRALRETRVLR